VKSRGMAGLPDAEGLLGTREAEANMIRENAKSYFCDASRISASTLGSMRDTIMSTPAGLG
jgi:hypothetical protein